MSLFIILITFVTSPHSIQSRWREVAARQRKHEKTIIMKHRNKSPERISFSEIKRLLKDIGGKDSLLPFLRKDIGMFYTGHPKLLSILKAGTPYIIEDCRIGLIRQGSAVATMNMIERTMEKGTLAYVGSGSIVQFKSFSEDFDFCGMMLSNDKLNVALMGNVPSAFSSNAPCILIDSTEEETGIADRMLHLIWDLIHADTVPEDTVNGLVSSVIHYYDHLNRRDEETKGSKKPHNKVMFDKFISLVNRHGKTEHSLSFYAGEMCITPRYLGAVVKSTSGITAKEWIDRAVVTSAKVMLRHTNKQVAQVADELHFPNTSFFCKFFKRLTGVTPQTYREESIGS